MTGAGGALQNRGQWRGVALVVGLLALAAGLTARGVDFYATDMQMRVDHPEFRTLSPSGPIGHGYGIVGTVLILTNLLYLLRRRFARMRLGTMKGWLDMHVVTGLFGSVLVVFHSAFQLRSGIASLTAYSLGLVVVSGVIGRYFYALSPESDGQALRSAQDALSTLWPALGTHVSEALAAQAPPSTPARPSLRRALATIPAWRRELRARRNGLRQLGEGAIAGAGLDKAQGAQVRKLVAAVADASGAEVKRAAGAALLRSWRGLHRFMALLMVLSVSVHIAVAWYYGFRWVLSDP